MATYHLSVKFGGKGHASCADYIERKEKYRDRQDLEYSAHGNMPEWARDNPSICRRLTSLNVRTVRPIGNLKLHYPCELTPNSALNWCRILYVRKLANGTPQEFCHSQSESEH
ncbi:hypothetical protein [Escherichia coli]